jgi:hypothetical protein
MEPQKIHYTAGGNPSHAGVFILPEGKDIERIVIDHIEWRENEKINGAEKSVFVAIFQPNIYTKLPMVLNKVNKERLLKAARVGSFDLLTIKNFPVRLTFEPTNVGDGLRISKLPAKAPVVAEPSQKKKLEVTEENFGKAVEFLKTKTMQDLRGFYDVSPEMEKRLMEKCEDLTQKSAE